MACSVVQPVEGRCQKAKVAVDRTDAPLRVPDGMSSRQRLQLPVQRIRPLGLVQTGNGLRGEARAQEPFVVRVQGSEVVARQFLEDAARLAGPSELDEQARERRPMERIPGEFIDRRPNLKLLAGQLPTLALEEEAMKSRRRDVVPGECEVRLGIRLFADQLLRGREVALHERHQRAGEIPSHR